MLILNVSHEDKVATVELNSHELSTIMNALAKSTMPTQKETKLREDFAVLNSIASFGHVNLAGTSEGEVLSKLSTPATDNSIVADILKNLPSGPDLRLNEMNNSDETVAENDQSSQPDKVKLVSSKFAEPDPVPYFKK